MRADSRRGVDDRREERPTRAELLSRRSGQNDPKVQVYAAGVLGYELLTGQARAAAGHAAGPELTGSLGDVVRRALAVDRRGRIEDLRQLHEAVEEVQPRPPSEGERNILSALRNRFSRTSPEKEGVAKLIDRLHQLETQVAQLGKAQARLEASQRESSETIERFEIGQTRAARPAGPPVGGRSSHGGRGAHLRGGLRRSLAFGLLAIPPRSGPLPMANAPPPPPEPVEMAPAARDAAVAAAKPRHREAGAPSANPRRLRGSEACSAEAKPAPAEAKPAPAEASLLRLKPRRSPQKLLRMREPLLPPRMETPTQVSRPTPMPARRHRLQPQRRRQQDASRPRTRTQPCCTLSLSLRSVAAKRPSRKERRRSAGELQGRARERADHRSRVPRPRHGVRDAGARRGSAAGLRQVSAAYAEGARRARDPPVDGRVAGRARKRGRNGSSARAAMLCRKRSLA